MTQNQPTVGRLISRISRLSQRWLDRRLKKLEISGAAVPVLALIKAGERLTQRELALRIGTEQSTMAQLLNRMERDQLIVREANPDDGRSTYVVLTESAARSLPAAANILREGNASVTANFSRKELATLVSLLERYLANVEKELG